MTPEPRPPADWTIAILTAATFLYTLAVAAAVIWLPQNQQLTTLLAGQLTGFSGALLLRLKS